MARDANDQSDHPQAPWWWGMGPIGAALLIVLGLAFGLWASLSSDPADLSSGYGAVKAVAIGLVVFGSAALERVRSRRLRKTETEDRQLNEG